MHGETETVFCVVFLPCIQDQFIFEKKRVSSRQEFEKYITALDMSDKEVLAWMNTTMME
jgi:succinate dehydrogenase flavin-adding protein (antitoxin of CptAB toxin-antitoxin module)